MLTIIENFIKNQLQEPTVILLLLIIILGIIFLLMIRMSEKPINAIGEIFLKFFEILCRELTGRAGKTGKINIAMVLGFIFLTIILFVSEHHFKYIYPSGDHSNYVIIAIICTTVIGITSLYAIYSIEKTEKN